MNFTGNYLFVPMHCIFIKPDWSLIYFCLLMYEPHWLLKKGKKYSEDINICINYGGFFCGPWKVAIIVEKYLPNVCNDLSFHNHINYQRNPVVFIHVFISHIHSSLFVSWFLLKNLIILKLWIYTVRSEILWHRQHILRMYLSLKENPTYTVVKSWHVCAWVTITY